MSGSRTLPFVDIRDVTRFCSELFAEHSDSHLASVVTVSYLLALNEGTAAQYADAYQHKYGLPMPRFGGAP